MENENKENSKETASILLKHFDNIFHTNTSYNIDYYFNKLKMLQNIYNVLEEDLCTSNPQYKELRKQHIDITDMLENSLTKGQQALFEKHLDTGSEMVSVECEQMFYFGYIIAKILEQDIRIEKVSK